MDINSCNPLTLQKIKLLKTVFEIGSDTAGCNTVLLEIGDNYCCYALIKGQERSFRQIKYFAANVIEDYQDLATVLDEIKNGYCKKVIVCAAFSQALLIPNMYSESQQALLNAVYDLPFHKHFTDRISEWQLLTSYSLPVSVFNLVVDRFPSARFIHAYTPALKIYNGFVAPDQVDIHFNTGHFRVLVKKNKQLQLAQTYGYKTPLDVVYYLLKISYEFQLKQSEVYLIVSGLIDKDSALYNELHHYFLNLHFAQGPEFSLPQSEHPHHYFTSLYNLAACES